MKLEKNKLLVTILTCFYLNLALSQDVVRINFNCKNEIKKYEDLKTVINFSLLKDTILILPKISYIGYKDDLESDFYYELEKIENNSFIKISPTADYEYFYLAEGQIEYDSLKMYSSKIIQSSLSFYSFKTGNYRARIIFNLFKYFKSETIAYSNWQYFHIKDKIIY